MNWFYESAGKQQGPVSDTDLDRMLAEGVITPATLIWREGLPDWQPLSVARPTVPPLSAVAGTAGEIVVCASCGRLFPTSDVIQIGGRPICADCKPAVLQSLQQGGELPAAGDHDRNGPAWEQRVQLGIFPALWATLREVLTKPAEAFSRMKREGGIGSPLLYYVIIGSIGNLCNLGYQMLFQVGGLAIAPQAQEVPNPVAAFMATGLGMALIAVLMPAFIALSSFMTSGILHLSLMICGGAKRPFETTFRVHCYATGSGTALMVIPICGGVVGGIWSLVATIIGVAKAHQIPTGKAALAVLLPFIVCCASVIALVVLVGAFAGAGAIAAQR